LTTSIASTASISLSSDTVFIYAFPDAKIKSTMSVVDNSFQLSFAFKVISATNFTV